MSTNFTIDELNTVAKYFGIEQINPVSIKIVWRESPCKNRNETLCYNLYKHDDGFRWRRRVRNGFFKRESRYYQMRRNSATGNWPAFKNIYEATDYMINYRANIKA